MENKSEIIIYQAEDGTTAIDVRIEQESVWLTQQQLALLFGQTKQNISLHISNVFKENELDKASVVKEYLTTAADNKQYKTQFYNLDVIISVGYRVKSKRGTQFRFWANSILKQYLIKGFSLNEKRLKEQSQKQLLELQRTVKFIQSVASQKVLTTEESSGLLNVIADYTLALDVLDQFDHEELQISGTERKQKFRIDYRNSRHHCRCHSNSRPSFTLRNLSINNNPVCLRTRKSQRLLVTRNCFGVIYSRIKFTQQCVVEMIGGEV